jgi:hypothetical protein
MLETKEKFYGLAEDGFVFSNRERAVDWTSDDR